MYLTKLLEVVEIKRDPDPDKDVVVLPTGLFPWCDISLVVPRVKWDEVYVECRATEPDIEPVFAAIGSGQNKEFLRSFASNEPVRERYTELRTALEVSEAPDVEDTPEVPEFGQLAGEEAKEVSGREQWPVGPPTDDAAEGTAAEKVDELSAEETAEPTEGPEAFTGSEPAPSREMYIPGLSELIREAESEVGGDDQGPANILDGGDLDFPEEREAEDPLMHGAFGVAPEEPTSAEQSVDVLETPESPEVPERANVLLEPEPAASVYTAAAPEPVPAPAAEPEDAEKAPASGRQPGRVLSSDIAFEVSSICETAKADGAIAHTGMESSEIESCVRAFANLYDDYNATLVSVDFTVVLKCNGIASAEEFAAKLSEVRGADVRAPEDNEQFIRQLVDSYVDAMSMLVSGNADGALEIAKFYSSLIYEG